jgi:hypothetical protein
MGMADRRLGESSDLPWKEAVRLMRNLLKTLRIIGVAALVTVFFSCAALDKDTAQKASSQKRLPDNYEFEDVLIPRELDLDKEASFIYRSEGLKAGLLRFSGRVEMSSLMRFFANNMPKDGWRVVSQFRSPQSLMLFQKGNRMCVVAIEDADFKTYTDVWVVPMNESLDAGTQK